jgi:DNA-binding GntR family transcriptional regulator
MEIRRDCMRDQIRRELLRRIVDGRYRPGERLVELQVAREFNTSQGPVREAFRELEALRLVETETYRGTRVRALSERELREAAVVRGVLEEAAAVAAAEALRGQTGPLREEVAAIERAAREGDLDAYARHNMAFHRRIVEAAGNGVLLHAWDALLLEARTLIHLSTAGTDLNAAAATHLPIIEALDRGDGPLAGRLLREHAESFHRNTPPASAANQVPGDPSRPAPAATAR